MPRVIAAIAAAVLIVGLVVWMWPQGPLPPAPDPQGAVQEDTATIEDQGPYHEVEVTYPTKTPAGAEAALAMKTFAEKEVAAFKDRSGLMTLTQADIEMMGLGGERKFALDIKYKSYASATTVSYVFTIYEDTLGAHPNGYYRTFTFDLASGEGLIITDLFDPSVDYLSVLSEKSRASLYATLGENASRDMLEAGTTPYLDNFQNWYLTDTELVIIFAPYQVGPWAIGTQEVRIPKTGITALLRTEYR